MNRHLCIINCHTGQYSVLFGWQYNMDANFGLHGETINTAIRSKYTSFKLVLYAHKIFTTIHQINILLADIIIVIILVGGSCGSFCSGGGGSGWRNNMKYAGTSLRDSIQGSIAAGKPILKLVFPFQ